MPEDRFDEWYFTGDQYSDIDVHPCVSTYDPTERQSLIVYVSEPGEGCSIVLSPEQAAELYDYLGRYLEFVTKPVKE